MEEPRYPSADKDRDNKVHIHNVPIKKTELLFVIKKTSFCNRQRL